MHYIRHMKRFNVWNEVDLLPIYSTSPVEYNGRWTQTNLSNLIVSNVAALVKFDVRTSVTADMDPPSQIWTPLPNFLFKHCLYRIWWIILFASFLSTFFSITRQHSLIKVKKKPAISSQFCRIYYSESYTKRKI